MRAIMKKGVKGLNYETRHYQCIQGLIYEGKREYRMLGTVEEANRISQQTGFKYSSYKNENDKECFKFTW